MEAQARERLLVVSPLLGGAERSNFTWNQPVVAIQAPGHNDTVPVTSQVVLVTSRKRID